MKREGRNQKPEVGGQRSEVSGQWSVVSGQKAAASCRAFTMLEIAISLAVIGFALVAILGVLPLGMNVQKENREETIINQDATVFLSAIRNGAQGMDDLTNYVLAITNYPTRFRSDGTVMTKYPPNWYTPTNSSSGFALYNGYRIIGLLSTPKYITLNNGDFYSNYVVAAVRSLSGPVSDKFPQNNAALQDLAFSYRMISEVIPFGTDYHDHSWVSTNLQSNLHDVRLTFRWPLAQGAKATGRQVYRTLVGGSLQETNEPGFPRPSQFVPSPYDLYFFNPGAYVQAKLP
jgi:type II secretory pathway pseudopilin PulG